MSLVPEFERGLCNAWILPLFYLLSFVVRYVLYRLRGEQGLGRPITPPLNEKEHKLDVIGTLIFLAFVIYSFFLPLKLGTAWLYIGLIVYLFGMILNIVAGENLVNTPLDRPATKGLYSISRNPIYLSTSLMFIGTGIACASWLFLLLIAISIILQNITIDAEERWCLEKYGDAYREYMGRTPKWIGIPKSEKKD
ncbi:MAG: isoprenylcysteine carboxylmethyltransferase family protein [Candidatus Bathyarchaeota archaeon]|jgi:protein-S-isoprenylcysteine O-methyltransferase Ste14